MKQEKLAFNEYLTQAQELLDNGYVPGAFESEPMTVDILARKLEKADKKEFPDLPEGTVMSSNPNLDLN